tara:strand:+ start:89 stop:256 length:168 start_codon:yes stop_codon:yes gene_type:complete
MASTDEALNSVLKALISRSATACSRANDGNDGEGRTLLSFPIAMLWRVHLSMKPG